MIVSGKPKINHYKSTVCNETYPMNKRIVQKEEEF